MDAQHFDAFVRAISNGASRRGLLAGMAGGLLAPLAGGGLGEVLAKKGKKAKTGKKGKKGKKKKKSAQCKANQEQCGKSCCNGGQTCIDGTCLGACQSLLVDDDDLKTTTLQDNCATTQTILIENGFTLEGAGNTIHMAGPVSGYQSVTIAQTAVRAGVLIQDGTGSVKNLTIDQDALECGGAQAHSAIVMAKGKGDIEAVDIVVTNDDVQCYRGIDAETAANNDVVNVRSVTITGGHTRAMAISGPTPPDGSSLVAGEIRDCTISDALFGMLLNATKQQITGNAVTARVGISVGVFPSNVVIDGNTITGVTGAVSSIGINFNDDTKGTVSNNTISGFTCGITILEDADITIGTGNTLSSNTDNFCPPPP